MNKSEKTQISFLVFPGFPMACLTSMIEPLRAANEIAGAERFAWALVSEDGARVMSSAKVGFDPDMALRDVDGVDALILLSPPTAAFAQEKSSMGKLRALARHGCILGGISGGVFPLVRAGVMEGQTVSVHWCYATAFRSAFPQIVASDQVLVTQGQRFTASGAAAAFDLALHLIDQAFGPEITYEVACWFQHSTMRGESVRQQVPVVDRAGYALDGLVGRAAMMFANRIEDPTSVAEVAEALGVTPRQVERAFKKATGQSPSHFYRGLRMKAARQLVLYSGDSLGQIASAVGYGSVAPLKQHYEAAFGVSPSADRARINGFRVTENMPLPSS